MALLHPFSFEGICADGETQTRGGVSTTCTGETIDDTCAN
jgi:hypothetical protein